MSRLHVALLLLTVASCQTAGTPSAEPPMTGDPCQITATQLPPADDCSGGVSATVEGNPHRLCERIARDFCFARAPRAGDAFIAGASINQQDEVFHNTVPCVESGAWPDFAAQPAIAVANDPSAESTNPATGHRVLKRARVTVTGVSGSACARAHYLLARLASPVSQASDTDEPLAAR